ncbi:MAG TPA: hypothetical protein VGL99_19455 [Chloroflexota bacterium]
MTSFIGRKHELAEVGRLLETTRLLTLTGPGGIGNTRVAAQLAQHANFEAIEFVDLAPSLMQRWCPRLSRRVWA